MSTYWRHPTTLGLKTKKAEVAPNLDPLENRKVACIYEEHEEVLL
jgi:hypothetical protein